MARRLDVLRVSLTAPASLDIDQRMLLHTSLSFLYVGSTSFASDKYVTIDFNSLRSLHLILEPSNLE